jgi:uncharacterized protein YjgD (DUF1641 family)
MNETHIQQQIDGINQKLDIILEEIELQRRHRREIDDLKEDLTRVGKDLFQTAVVELEEVHDHLNTGDMLYLTKKLLRNVRNITHMFEQLENARGFLDDFSPVFRDFTISFMDNLDEYDRKGYFDFVRELVRLTDHVVTSFSVEDVRKLGDNIVTMLNIVKDLTQPDMLHAVNNALSVYKNMDAEVPENVTLMSLISELRTPETKRSLAFGIKILQNMTARLPEATTAEPA